MSSSGLSNVGSGSLYEAGDQRNAPQTVYDERAKFEQGQHRSHKNLDSKDERSIGNRLAAQENSSNPDKPTASNYDPEAELSKRNPEAPAVLHGHEPSRGAKVDHDLQADDEQRLREKGIKK
uniref:Uncharacterized protein n=1 Tax=Hirondellea gigas TaxID=1518452 RepID=A0A6A7GCE1_9CRUS